MDDRVGSPGGAPAPRRGHGMKALFEAKALAPQRVTALLKKAGFAKATYHRSGQVKGWGEWSVGFACSNAYGVAGVFVDYKQSHWAWRAYGQAKADKMLSQYAAALAPHGLVTAFKNGRLIVTNLSEEQAK